MYIIGMKKLSLLLAFLLSSSAFAEKLSKEECLKYSYTENGEQYYNGQKVLFGGNLFLHSTCEKFGVSVKGYKEYKAKEDSSRAYWDNRVKEVGQEQASKEWNEQRKSKKPSK